MKVMIVNSESGMRGGEHQSLSLARGLSERGCEVVLAAARGSEIAAVESNDFRIERYRFENIPFQTPLELRKRISLLEPDILHAQTSKAHTHLWITCRMLRHPPPLVVSRRVAFDISRGVGSYFKYRTGVARYIPISRAAALSLERRGVPGEIMRIVHSGVDTDALASASPDKGLLDEWGVHGFDFIVGTVAAIESEKGHEVLIEAACKVLDEYPRTCFLFIGRGRLRKRISGRIEDRGLAGNVRIVEPVQPIGRVLSLLDLFVLPSMREGLSTALISALAAGLPAVASDTGGIPEVLGERGGLLVPPGDAESLASAIRRMIQDGELREGFAKMGPERARMFDISSMIDGTYRVYLDILG